MRRVGRQQPLMIYQLLWVIGRFGLFGALAGRALGQPCSRFIKDRSLNRLSSSEVAIDRFLSVDTV